MEEYRDLHLTVDVFKSVLDESEFDRLEAGIVLQAYLPDSFEVLQSLTEWARQRKQRTGTGIKVRLVKGANLAMETVEASLREWEQAPYHSKQEVDANFKRMLEYASRPENAEVVRIGVGSHNLFDIAYAMLLRSRRGVEDRIEFEMLEGMANAQATEVRERSGGLIVYTPVVLDAEFESAVAYLVRRLDENTAPGSFLGALFALSEGTPEWKEQSEAFLSACEMAFDPDLMTGPNRQQNRLTEHIETVPADSPFHNVPDTDFSLPENRLWCEQIHRTWVDRDPDPIPLVIGGQEIGLRSHEDRLTGTAKDPSRPGHQAYQFAQAIAEDIDRALQVAVEAQPSWQARGVEGRQKILLDIAAELGRNRGRSIGAMLLDAGKNVVEADVEVSEAIDFANYYASGLSSPGWTDGTQALPFGVVVVTPPWNFPFAIPAGGVLAALMAGNSVILKPARESVLTAWTLAEQLWDAGVPKDVLQFTPTVDGETGKQLITDSRTSAVILTGSVFTAQLFHSWRPDLRLFAETSGKNAMIITAAADLDLAIKDLVRGAFGHAGQKCSATSLALVEAEVYDNPKFMNQLKDAAQSLTVGGSWNLSATVTPVIREPDEFLSKGLTELQDGEKWLLEPRMVDDNPCHWTPGIRINVKPGSWYHQTECFGPVLGMIRVKDFNEAIEIQNSSEFGLTGGLHSLDPKEIEEWRERVEVGNAYINRTTTGAIVQRQPFGGWKKSCVGPGPKAGGPNYVASFCDWVEERLPSLGQQPTASAAKLLAELKSKITDSNVAAQLDAAAASYAYWWAQEFGREHDPSQIHGETNHFLYRPLSWHFVRLQSTSETQIDDAAKIALAAATTNTRLIFSVRESAGIYHLLKEIGFTPQVESDDQSIQSVQKLHRERASLKHCPGGTLRIIGSYEPQVFRPELLENVPIVAPYALANGRIELLKFLKEQSVSETVHRYGNIV